MLEAENKAFVDIFKIKVHNFKSILSVVEDRNIYKHEFE